MRALILAILFLCPLLGSQAATDPFEVDREIINSGSMPNDKTGDTPYLWSRKDNNNTKTLFDRTAALKAGLDAALSATNGRAYNLKIQGVSVGALTNIDLSPLHGVVSDEDGVLMSSEATVDEIGNLAGTTGPVQAQIDAKQPLHTNLTSVATGEGRAAHWSASGATDATLPGIASVDTLRFGTRPAGSTNGTPAVQYWEGSFSGVADPITSFGYNQNASGAQVLTNEPSISMNFESRYLDADSTNKAELYWQYTKPGAASFWRPYFAQINRNSDYTKDIITGDYLAFTKRDQSICWDSYPNLFQLRAPNSAVNILRMATVGPSNGATFHMGWGGVDDRFTIQTVDTNTVWISVAGQSGIYLYRRFIGANNGIALGINAQDNNAALTVDQGNNHPTMKTLVARKSVAQTASIFEVQDSSQNGLVKVDKDGNLIAGALEATNAVVDAILTIGKQPAGATNALPTLQYFEGSFSGVSDPTFALGYNITTNGAQSLASEPSLSMAFESRYRDSDGTNKVEWYTQYQPSGGGTGWRPFFWQINRETGYTKNIIAGDYLSFTKADGSINWDCYPNLFQLRAPNSAVNILRMATVGPSNGATFHMGWGGVDDRFTIQTVATNTVWFSVAGQSGIYLYRRFIGSNNGIALGINAQDNNAALTVDQGNNHPTMKTLVARRSAAQTASIFEVQDESQNALVKVDKDGNLTSPSIRATTSSTPSSATDTGLPGQIKWDASYVYVCTATNTWKRAALSSW